jgi:uncharacterized membrane protein (UPF0136 family)
MYSLYFYVFAALTIGGGVMGFVKAKSRASLIAGSVSGGLLLAAGWLVQSAHAMPGFILGGLVSLALVGRFAPAYRKQHKFFPAGLMAVLGITGIAVAVLGTAR